MKILVSENKREPSRTHQTIIDVTPYISPYKIQVYNVTRSLITFNFAFLLEPRNADQVSLQAPSIVVVYRTHFGICVNHSHGVYVLNSILSSTSVLRILVFVLITLMVFALRNLPRYYLVANHSPEICVTHP